MPSQQNNQNKTGQPARPTHSTRNASRKAAPVEIESEFPETTAAPQGDPEADDTSETLLDQEERGRRTAEQATLMYLSLYHDLEHALLRAGFIRARSTPGSSQPDWIGFARHIERRFQPDRSDGLKLAVTHLLEGGKNQVLRGQRLENYSPLENGIQHDIDWIAELLQHTRNLLVHELNFPGRAGCDLNQIMAAMFVVQDWSHLDPQVEGLLDYLQ